MQRLFAIGVPAITVSVVIWWLFYSCFLWMGASSGLAHLGVAFAFVVFITLYMCGGALRVTQLLVMTLLTGVLGVMKFKQII